jgi:uncharacterized protein (DUF1684 family)
MRNFFAVVMMLFIQGVAAQTYNDSLKAFREKYRNDFLTDVRSPIKQKENLKFIQFFEGDSSYRISTSFMKAENATPFEMATLNGKTKTYVEYGIISFFLGGKNLSLKIYQSISLMSNPEYRDHLFLPFTDLTNGDETYEAGRYLDFTISDIHDSILVVDFNKSYNPYCAYSPGYSCPKPPQENALPIKILAGEKNFSGQGH